MDMVQVYTKDSLIKKLSEISAMGWIPSRRQGNAGGIGNTLEDLLGIQENNLPIPNAAEWELKCQRIGSSSLTTLFHYEPSPQALRFVPLVLLPKYGWAHKTLANERSFRQTIHAVLELNPQPYWGFDDLQNKAGTKLLNCFYVQASAKKERGIEYFHYQRAQILTQFDFKKFLIAIEKGWVLVDFDARTKHNHGTKFRLRQDHLPDLYDNIKTIF